MPGCTPGDAPRIREQSGGRTCLDSHLSVVSCPIRTGTTPGGVPCRRENGGARRGAALLICPVKPDRAPCCMDAGGGAERLIAKDRPRRA